MVVLIDILHPAHVHFFKHLIQVLPRHNHRVIVTAREKEMSIDLLRSYAIPHMVISKQKRGIGLALEMITRTAILLGICLKYKPQILMGIMGPSIAVVGFILRIKSWIFYDTENAWITNCFAYPLANRIYTPQCYQGYIKKNHKPYAGYHELSYLHPDIFKPDKSILTSYGIDAENPYALVRFVSWQASHDIGESGIGIADKETLLSHLEKYGPVYVSSEAFLPPSMRDKQIPLPITKIHHLIAYARVVVGESATMASEAAVLGVPALYISDTHRGYTIDQEKKYGLVYNLRRDEIERALSIIATLYNDPNSRKKYQNQRLRLLDGTINLSHYIYTEVETFLKGGPSCAV